MFIIVVGCGRVGAELAYRLYQRGHQVAVIDQVGTSFTNLDPDYRGRTIEGEVLSQDVLTRAGIEEADGLAAVTNSDSVNAVIGHMAREVYKVRNVVVRNYNPRWLPMHHAFGLQVVSSTAWGAQRIEELLYQPLGRAVFSAGNGEVEIYEVMVPESWKGRRLAEVLAGVEAMAAAFTRGGRSMLPASDLTLEPGDVLHVSATLPGIEALRERAAAAGGPR
jgi:trk system potassium uptake protein TrkA